MRAHLFLYEEVDPTREDLVSVAQWLHAEPDQIEVHIKQEPIDKFLGQIKEMHGTFSEFPKDERRTNKILRLLKQGATPMPMYVEQGDKDLFVMEGRHRMVAFWLAGAKTVPVAYVSKKLDETINPDILNKKFNHTQVIGDYTYKASVEIFMDEPLLNIKAYDGNKEIGHIMFEIFDWEDDTSSGYMESGGTEVDPKYRNKGVASTMYAYAKMLGNTIEPSIHQLKPGKKMWKSWKKAGDAEHLMKESEFRPMTLKMGDYRGPYHPETMRPYEGFKDSLGLAEIVDNLIDNGVPPKVVTVSPRTLFATQDWLSDYGSAEASFPEYQDKPVVLNHDGKMQILDGHHRCANALKNGKMVTVYLFDIMDDDLDEETLTEYERDTPNSRQIFSKLEGLGYKKLGHGADATVWAKDDNHVIKILMPSRGYVNNAINAEKGFMAFYDFCRAHADVPNLPRFIDIGGQGHAVFEINGTPYRQIAMERLQPITKGSFEEAMVWMLSDLAKIRAPWSNVVNMLKKPETWPGPDDHAVIGGMKHMPDMITKMFADPAVSKQYGILYLTMGRLYHSGLRSGLGWDLHTENAMMRRDGTIVIVDPYFT